VTKVKKEIKKQLIDQPLHLLMAIASVCAFTWLFKGQVWVASGLTVTWIAYREFLQWPSDRWWDPPLDATFEIAGVVAGYFIAVRWIV